MSKLMFDQRGQLTWLKPPADISHQIVSSWYSGGELTKIRFFTYTENYLAY